MQIEKAILLRREGKMLVGFDRTNPVICELNDKDDFGVILTKQTPFIINETRKEKAFVDFIKKQL